jgi:hypothetical protein
MYCDFFLKAALDRTVNLFKISFKNRIQKSYWSIKSKFLDCHVYIEAYSTVCQLISKFYATFLTVFQV